MPISYFGIMSLVYYDAETDGVHTMNAEISPTEARFGGEGLWVAIQRDPETGELRAASHNRNNSSAVAW